MIVASNTTDVVTDQSQIYFFEKKDKLIGGLGEEKIKDSKILNNIKWMVRFATGEGQGFSASIGSLILLDLSGSRVYSGFFYKSFLDGLCLWGGLNRKD